MEISLSNDFYLIKIKNLFLFRRISSSFPAKIKFQEIFDILNSLSIHLYETK